MTDVSQGRRRRPLGFRAPLLALTLSLAAALPARAADALHGKALYANTPGGISCANSSCHGPDPTQNQNKILNGANNPSLIQAAINNNTGGMGIFKTTLSATDVADIAAYLGNPNVTAAPVASVSPASLSFASTAVGSTSTAQTVTLSNTGTATLSISSISLSTADFVRTGGTCAAGGSVAAGANCTLLVAFRPQASGTRSGTLSIAHNAAGGSSSVGLSGTGSATAVPGVSPASLNFGSVNVGATSATQTVTVSNTGSAPMTLGTIASSSAQFPISGGSCASGVVVAAGTGSCTVLVAFAPSAGGAASGTLSIANNASATPLGVALAGTGTVPAVPVAALSPTALTFSEVVGVASPAQTLTLSNSGNGPLSISSVSLGGTAAADYMLAGGTTCVAGGSVAAGASCLVQIVFTPSATGSRPATLSIVHNDSAHSPSTASLAGTGTTAATGALSVNRNALSFAAQSLGTTSAAQVVTVGNSGAAPLTLATIALGGSNAGDFALAAGGSACVAGQSLAVGATCTLGVTFTPTVASGTRSASIALGAGSAGSATISLSGLAAAANAPILTLTPASLDFGSVVTGSTSAALTSTLGNSGTAPLNLGSLTVGGSGFTLSHNCPATLAAGSQCTLSLRFAPVVAGSATGSVAIVSNAASSPVALALAGTGSAPAIGTLVWSGASTLAFPDTATGAQSAPLPLLLLNSGTGPALLQGFTFSGAAGSEFHVDASSSCVTGATLAAGGSCTLQVVFAPAASGLRSASLAVASNATPPTAAGVSGNGVSGGVPVLGLTPSAISLVGAPNQPLQPQTLVLRNDGAAPLTVSAMQADAGIVLLDAGATGGGSCSAPPFTLAPASSCTVVVQPTGSVVNGTIRITSNATALPATVSVSGSALSNVGAGGSAIGLLALLAAPLLRRRRAQS